MEGQWVIPGAWLSVGLTLAVYSFLYDDNPFFRIAEHLYIGVSVGYFMVLSYTDYILKKFFTPLFVDGQLWVLFPAVLGILIFTRYIPKVRWLSRWTFAAVMGWTAGVAIPRTVSEFLLAQIRDTVQPLLGSATAADGSSYLLFGGEQVATIIVLVGVIAVLVHFFFSVEHTGPVRVTARTGVLFLMIAFGAAFGSTTMARMSLLYGRLYELKEFSSAEYYYATPILLAGIVVGLALWRRIEQRVLPGEDQPTT